MRREGPILGLGGIVEARKWGVSQRQPPTTEQVKTFYKRAFNHGQGIKVFDTAPSYASYDPTQGVISGEERLGLFLKGLPPFERQQITVITKFGEYFDKDRTPQYYPDHSFETLRSSLDNSVSLLGSAPDILLVHKTTKDVLASPDVDRAIEYARSYYDIQTFGVSASDPEVARLAVEDPRKRFSVIQIPFNPVREDREQFAEVIRLAHEKGVRIIVNRPFEEGKIGTETQDTNLRRQKRIEAMQFIVSNLDKDDIVLTGTGDIRHLADNKRIFDEAVRRDQVISRRSRGTWFQPRE